jgi:hypothetical protein
MPSTLREKSARAAAVSFVAGRQFPKLLELALGGEERRDRAIDLLEPHGVWIARRARPPNG